MTRQQRTEAAFAECRGYMARLLVLKRRAQSLAAKGQDHSRVLEEVAALEDPIGDVLDKVRAILDEMQAEGATQQEIRRLIHRTERECTLNLVL